MTVKHEEPTNRGDERARVRERYGLIRTAFGFIGISFIGIRNIHFVGVGYDEFADDRINRSLASGEVTIKQLARELAKAWSAKSESISEVVDSV